MSIYHAALVPHCAMVPISVDCDDRVCHLSAARASMFSHVSASWREVHVTGVAQVVCSTEERRNVCQRVDSTWPGNLPEMCGVWLHEYPAVRKWIEYCFISRITVADWVRTAVIYFCGSVVADGKLGCASKSHTIRYKRRLFKYRTQAYNIWEFNGQQSRMLRMRNNEDETKAKLAFHLPHRDDQWRIKKFWKRRGRKRIY